MVPPENAQIIYVNERGQVKKSLDKFTMGTIAEIQCQNDTVLEGESFLTCSENTQWDYPMPKCVRELTRTTNNIPGEDSTANDDHSIDMRSTETVDKFLIDNVKQLSLESESLIASTYNYENDNESEEFLLELQTTTESTKLDTTSDNEAKKLTFPDQHFWKNLRRFLYHGCSSYTAQNKRSELCSLIPLNESKFSDLSNFESSDSGEYRSMDTKLLMHLKNAWKLSSNYEKSITFENLFEFILYGQEENLNQIPSSEEKLLRLILSFYIDAIMFDRNSANALIETEEEYGDAFENITSQIKIFIVRLAAIAFRNMPEIPTTTTTIAETIDEITSTDDIISEESISVSQTSSDFNELSTSNYFTMTSDHPSMDNKSKNSHPDNCDLLLLPKLPSNSIIKNVSSTDTSIVVDVEKIRHQSTAVPVNTMVFYSCGKGYHLSGTGYSQCLPNGTWIETNFECICKYIKHYLIYFYYYC